MKSLFLLALLAASGMASANTVRQAMGNIEPIVNVKDGAVQGCGQRLVLIERGTDPAGHRFAIDASVSIYAQGFAMVKAGLLKFKPNNSGFTVLPIESFWLKGQGLGVTELLRSPGFLPATEPKGYLMSGSNLQSSGSLMGLFAEGKRSLMFGVRAKGEGMDYVFSGDLEFAPDQLKSFAECIDGLKGALTRAP